MSERTHARAAPAYGPAAAPAHQASPELAPPAVYDVLRSPGEPLDRRTRDLMESRFARDFSHVRVHAGPGPTESARAVGSLAYTAGNHVVFGAGQYAPGTQSGQLLLAHELAHVAQQGGLTGSSSRLPIGSATGAAEMQAARSAAAVAAGNRAGHLAPVPGPVLQRQVTGDEERYNLVLRMPPGYVGRHNQVSREEALKTLQLFLKRVAGYIEAGEYGHRDLRATLKDQWFVGTISNAMSLQWLPSLSIWEEPRNMLATSQQQIDSGQIAAAAATLQAAAEAVHQCHLKLVEYREGSIAGAGRAEFGLEVVQVAAAATITIGTGGTAGVLVGAAYGGAQMVARQATEVQLGMRDAIDWEGVAFDTLFGLITGYLGGKFGNYLLGRLLKHPATASLGRRVLSEAVSDLVSGRLSSFLHGAGKAVYDNLRGRSDITVEQFWSQMVDQMLDPKSGVLDIILGRASRVAAARIDASRPAAPPAPRPPSKRSTSRRGASLKARLLAASMRGTAEAVPAAAGTGGGPSLIDSPPAIVEPAGRTSPPPAAEPPSARPLESPQSHRAASESGLELDYGPQPTRETMPLNEVDLPGASEAPSGLELDRGPQPTREVAHGELTEAAMDANAARVPARGQFGDPSTEAGGTYARYGMDFHEYTAGEVANRLRVDYDPVAGRPRRVEYEVPASAATAKRQSDRAFGPDATQHAAQMESGDLANTGMDRGHLALRQAARGDPDVERSFDVTTAIIPQTVASNRGRGSSWRAAERREMQHAQRLGYVRVTVEPIYGSNPRRLPNGIPIPRAVRKIIRAPDGSVIEDMIHRNR